jgi:hypothetical protein
MSFAFTLKDGGDDWATTDDGAVVRTLRADGADELFDTSIVTYPAYRATHVDMRSQLEDAITLGRLPAPEVEATPAIEPEEIPAGDADTRTVALNELRALTSASVEVEEERLRAVKRRQFRLTTPEE